MIPDRRMMSIQAQVGGRPRQKWLRIMRKTSLILLLGAATGAAMTLFATQPNMTFAGTSAKAAVADTYRQLNLFGDVFERVRSDYVEKPDDSKLIESAINGMLAGLDPHSSYMDPKSFRDMQVQTRGEFGGLGIEVTMEDGLIKVVAPIDETPAAKAGILANDLITKLDDDQVQGMTLNQAVEKMRGPVNTKIKITIMRKGQDKPIEVSLTREVIRVRSVRSQLEGDDVGYIRMTQFTEKTTDGLKKAITDITAKMSNDKLKGYILDLRNNPGGLLDQAISVSSAFIQRGEIVSTRGRNPEETQRFTAQGGDLTKGKPVIVLINGGSASASEIVAGALQDQKRATILGTRSFGKGSVQTIIPLGSDNGALRLTTARYFTPSGRSIQAKGIVPDIEVLQDLPDDIKAKTDTSTKGEASLRGHLQGDAGKEQTGSQSYIPPDQKNDKALNMAEDLLRGIKVNPAFPPSVKNASSQK
jgi:carboxyl-terminal processing protease